MRRGHFTPRTPDEARNILILEANTPGELEVFLYRNEEGQSVMFSDWYPDKDDIRDLIAGKPIRLHIVGTIHPWVKVEVPE